MHDVLDRSNLVLASIQLHEFRALNALHGLQGANLHQTLKINIAMSVLAKEAMPFIAQATALAAHHRDFEHAHLQL